MIQSFIFMCVLLFSHMDCKSLMECKQRIVNSMSKKQQHWVIFASSTPKKEKSISFSWKLRKNHLQFYLACSWCSIVVYDVGII